MTDDRPGMNELLRAATGRQTPATDDELPAGGFDGGVRPMPRPKPSMSDLLRAAVRERRWQPREVDRSGRLVDDE